MIRKEKTLIVVVGPTASGKTDIAIELAEKLNTEIISADSRQFYKEIPIGTAAPNSEQLKKIDHHFIGHLSIADKYNVSQFEQNVLQHLKEKFKHKQLMILVGGSGLYIDAVCKGIDELPDPDEKLRSNLNRMYENEGVEALRNKLKELDPEYYKIVDLNNQKRLLRAIEVCMQTGSTFTSLRKNKRKPRNFRIVKIGLEIDRSILNERINKRTEIMIDNGWLEEAMSVYPHKHLNALNTVGYKEMFAHFDGEMSIEEAKEKIKTNTRRFAKRQMTWFEKDKEICWFNPTEKACVTGIMEMINYEISE